MITALNNLIKDRALPFALGIFLFFFTSACIDDAGSNNDINSISDVKTATLEKILGQTVEDFVNTNKNCKFVAVEDTQSSYNLVPMKIEGDKEKQGVRYIELKEKKKDENSYGYWANRDRLSRKGDKRYYPIPELAEQKKLYKELGINDNEVCSGIINYTGTTTSTTTSSNTTTSTQAPIIITYSWNESSIWGACNSKTLTQTKEFYCKASDSTPVADSYCPTTKPIKTRSCVAFSWYESPWGTCTGVIQTRDVYCRASNGIQAADVYCSGTKPVKTQSCLTYSWYFDSLGTCDSGTLTQTRDVYCKASNNTKVSDSNCPGTKPVSTQACITYSWYFDSLGTCDSGTLTQTRNVYCRALNNTKVADVNCSGAKLSSTQACILYSWHGDSWGTCDSGTLTQTRDVYCKASNGTKVADDNCLGIKPVSTQGCLTYSWYFDSLGTCDSGTLTQTRDVYCKASNGTKVADANCSGAKLSSTQACLTYSWYATDSWGTCDSGTLTQTRDVYCKAANGTKVSDSNCSGTKPVSTQGCLTYSWYFDSLGTCDSGTLTQTRNVYCRASNGTKVPDSNCAGAKLSSTQACLIYAWYESPWGTCNSGTLAQTRDVYCKASNNTKVANSNCSGTISITSLGCLIDKTGIEYVLVKNGKFTMGTNTGTTADEKPAHDVTITKDFYISKNEITNSEIVRLYNWAKENNISAFTCDGKQITYNKTTYTSIRVLYLGDAIGYLNANKLYVKDNKENYPCPNITWDGAKAIVDLFNIRESTSKYRLPSEAEWEYAARGGNLSKGYICSGSNNPNDVAWYSSNSGNTTHEVRKKAQNELGIYDMSGNVSEWVEDFYKSDYYTNSPANDPINTTYPQFNIHAIRGNAWPHPAGESRVTFRLNNFNSVSNNYTGSRLVRSN